MVRYQPVEPFWHKVVTGPGSYPVSSFYLNLMIAEKLKPTPSTVVRNKPALSHSIPQFYNTITYPHFSDRETEVYICRKCVCPNTRPVFFPLCFMSPQNSTIEHRRIGLSSMSLNNTEMNYSFITS